MGPLTMFADTATAEPELEPTGMCALAISPQFCRVEILHGELAKL